VSTYLTFVLIARLSTRKSRSPALELTLRPWEPVGGVKRTSVAVAGIALLLSGWALTLNGPSQARATSGPVFRPPQRYYLALGDSLAYGIQPAKVRAGLPPSAFDTGYVDVFAARLRALVPKIRVVNYGCPRESTKTFVAGGCPWLAGGRKLHNAFQRGQLGAALAFLRAHRGQVSPITLTVGGSDADALSAACVGNLACVRARAPRAIAALASRLTSILRRLRAAPPRAEIIVTGLWNNDVADLKGTDALVQSLDAAIARAAAEARARLADTFSVFNPRGSVVREKARICALTFTCSQGDGHPTDAGYRAIAAAVFAASGYKRGS
jgi:lysophospholipase L1-like esterase